MKKQKLLTIRTQKPDERPAVHLMFHYSLIALMMLIINLRTNSAQDSDSNLPVQRTLYVPFEELDILFDGSSEHVYLARDEYENLLLETQVQPVEKVPRPFVYSTVSHDISISGELATIRSSLNIDTLVDRWHAVPLSFQGIFLQAGKFKNGKPLTLGKNPNGQTIAFLNGKSTHGLILDFLAPVKLESARQTLQISLPPASSREIRVSVNGNVELASGAAVLSRTYEQESNTTRFQLVASRDAINLVMSVNNKKLQKKNSAFAKSVFIHELTSNYEQIHARVNVDIQYGALDELRFALPANFQVSEVTGPEIAGWNVSRVDGDSLLVVRLQEAVRKSFALNIAAASSRTDVSKWNLQQLKPLGLTGAISVVGIVAEERLELRSLDTAGLIVIDNDQIQTSIPETIFNTAVGAPAIATVAAFYAPSRDFSVTAEFATPPARLLSNPTSVLFLSDRQQKLIGQYQLTAEHEKAVSFDLDVPAGWRITSMRGGDGKAVPFQRNQQDGQTILNVRIPGGLSTGSTKSFVFEAEKSSREWAEDWSKIEIEFPRFHVLGADLKKGAIAVAVEDDLIVRPVVTTRLETLLKDQQSLFDLEGFKTSLAFEIVDREFSANLLVERLIPQVTATSYNFFRLLNKQIQANYEIAFEIRNARSRSLKFSLPVSTPRELRIQGLGGTRISQIDSIEEEDSRIWTIELAEPSLGEIRVAVDFLQSLNSDEPKDFVLPLIKNPAVGYQTTLVALEGNPDFDVTLKTTMRSIDIGEMGDAQHVPGARILGAFSASGSEGQLAIDVVRRDIHQLPTTIIQSASIQTLVSNNGQSQSIASYDLQTKVPYIELQLPESAKLWGAQLDGIPTRPQARGDSILISLPPNLNRRIRTLRLLYEDRIEDFGIAGKVKLDAPRLMANQRNDSSLKIPQAELSWQLILPTGYTITANDGTVSTIGGQPRPLPYESVSSNLLWGLREPLRFVADSLLESAANSLGKTQVESRVNQRFFMSDNADLDFAIDGEMAVETEDRSELASPDSPGKFSEPSDTPAGREQDGVRKQAEKPGNAPRPQTPGQDPSEPDFNDLLKNKDLSQVADSEDQRGSLLKKWFTKGIAGLTVSEISLLESENPENFQFKSLGNQPQISLSIVDENRVQWLAFAYGGLVLGFGLFLLRSTWRKKLSFLIGFVLIAAIVPLLGDWTEVLWMGLESSLYACVILALIYVGFAFIHLASRVMWGTCQRLYRWLFRRKNSRAIAIVTICLLGCWSSNLCGQQSGGQQNDTVKRPVKIPSDAIIVPYDPDKPEEESGQIFVPYKRYLELLEKKDLSKAASPRTLPAKFGWSRADYTATLIGNELTIQGTLLLECFADGTLEVPLNLEGAVLTRAELDNQPAQLQVITSRSKNSSPPQSQTVQQAKMVPQPAAPQIMLICKNPGTKTLSIELRMPINQEGGWKRASGRLPVTPASQIELVLPNPQAELNYRLGNQTIKFFSTANNKTATLPLDDNGNISLSWREQLATFKIDQNLSLASTALFDVRNDGLHLVWNFAFSFRGSKRSAFSTEIPKGYSVNRVYGSNVRGWEIAERADVRILSVTLLTEAEGDENFTIELSNRELDLSTARTFSLPALVIPDAAIHSGQITVRKSDSLDLQTDSMIGISRIDVTEARKVTAKNELLFNPSIFQAYEFSRTPYSVTIRCRPKQLGLTAHSRSVLDIRQKSCGLDSQVNISTLKPIHELVLRLPVDLQIQNIAIPTQFRKAIFRSQESQMLKLFLASGLTGDFSINITGRLKDHEETGIIPLPELKIEGAIQQTGEISAIAGTELIVEPDNLKNCESVLLSTVSGWLSQQNRKLARIAISHRSSDYSGSLKVSRKKPSISAVSVTNVNVTLRSIEESLMVSFDIRDAGVNQLSFLVPSELKDARLRADLVRQKTIEPVGDQATATQHRITLQLQDYVIGQYRVILERDRGLSAEELQAPIPAFETGLVKIDRFVTLQNSGFDELLVRESNGLDSLDRRQKPFRELRDLIGGADIRQGYLVKQETVLPILSYQTNPRQRVETVGASIGLSEIEMTIDRAGGFRAEQRLYLDNRTEPFLEIELPGKARLWTVEVAGEPVKPIAIDGDELAVRIPLIKTADGDTDFVVEIKYGGSLNRLSNLSRIQFPFAKTRNINVASSNVKLNLPEDFDFWWFDGTLGVSEESRIQQARSDYETALFSKLQSQAQNSKSELVRQRASQNLSLLEYSENTNAGARDGKDSRPEEQVDNRDRFNSVFDGQKIELFGNAGNVANTYGGNFGGEQSETSGAKADANHLNKKWFESNELVNPKVLEQNRSNTRFNAPAFQREPPVSKNPKGSTDKGKTQLRKKESPSNMPAQEEFKKQIVDNLNLLQEQSQKAQSQRQQRGGNSKEAVLRKYRSQLSNRDQLSNLEKMNNAMEPNSNRSPADDQGVTEGQGVIGGQGPTAGQAGGPPSVQIIASPGDPASAAFRSTSLDVDFVHRGHCYLFQAPSGELELEVTAISKSLQRRSVNFLVLLGVVFAMSGALWFFRPVRSV